MKNLMTNFDSLKNIICVCVLSAFGQNSLFAGSTGDSISGPVGVHIPESLFEEVYTNPASMPWSTFLPGNAVHASYGYENWENLNLVCLPGTRLSYYTVEAEYSKQIKNTTFWLQGSYNNSLMFDRAWDNVSEAAHMDMGPYVIADSIGGNSYGQRWGFSGGFATQFNKWILSMALSYDPGKDFRKTDLHPKSTKSNFRAELSIAVPVKKYYVGITGIYNDYRQDLKINVDDPNETYDLFTLRGYGNSDQHTVSAANPFSWTYDGYRLLANAFLFPESGEGWLANFKYKYQDLDSKNDANQERLSYNTNEYGLEFGRVFAQDNGVLQIKLGANYTAGIGTERNFVFTSTDPVDENERYGMTTWDIAVTARRDWDFGSNKHFAQLAAGPQNLNDRYNSSPYKSNYNHINLGAACGTEWSVKKSTWSATADLSYLGLINKEQVFPEDNVVFDNANFPDYDNSYRLSPFGAGLQLGYEYQVSEAASVFLMMDGHFYRAEKLNAYTTNVSIGIKF